MRRAGFRLAALGFGLLVGFAAIELGMWVAGIEVAGLAKGGDRDAAWRDCFEPSPTRGWTPVPGRCNRDQQGAFGGPFSTQADDRVRLLVVGDSVACQGVWIEIARAALSVRLGRPVEAVRFCASGYDTCQELDWLLEIGDVHDADLVVLQTCPNDLRPTPVALPLGNGWVEIRRGARSLAIPRGLLRSRLVRHLLLSGMQDANADGDAEELIAKCVAGFEQLAEDWGVPVVAVSFPLLVTDRPEVEKRALRQSETGMAQILAESSLPYLSLRAAMMERADRKEADPMYSWRDRPFDPIHPSKAAQWAIAPVVATFLIEQLAEGRSAEGMD